MSTRPWMPLYIGDFQLDTLDLDAAQIGVYLIMLMLAWRREDAALPNDMAFLKRSLKRCCADFHGHQFNRTVPTILERYWTLGEDQKWRNKRLTNERQTADKRSAKQKQNINKRWTNARQISDKRLAETSNINDLADTDVIPAFEDVVDTVVIPSQSQSQLQRKKEEKKEDKKHAADAASETRNKKGREGTYEFDGAVVRLTAADYGRWTRAYAHLDLRAELTARDAWLSQHPESVAQWFFSTSKYLANRNMEARAKAEALANKGAVKWRQGIEGVV